MTDILEILHYEGSPGLLRADQVDLTGFPDYAQVLRRAVEGCGLKAVYALRPRSREGNESIIPTVYVCDAASDKDADAVHQRVYNQNIVPFLIVQTPQGVRLYRGFQPAAPAPSQSPLPTRQGIFEVTIAFNEVARRLEALKAEAIDDGTIWRELGGDVTPETRVDWRLLRNLRALDAWLQKEHLERETRHSLIGRYVYLHYLRDRDILSNRKFAEWEMDSDAVLSRRATVAAFRELTARVDDWLKGAVFPLPESAWNQVEDRHLQYIAGIFDGDESAGGDAVQLALEFRIYDFSYIPIETLSVVYEQFLHAPDTPDDASEDEDASGKPSKGRDQGAYYTPVPLVNFMLAELDDRRPLQPGMRVLDPSCGSGAFLVQCYRRLIERARKRSESRKLRPEELKDLLVQSIYGVDSDADACRVAELSLVLALLDNVKPPDLHGHTGFHLPTLRDTNIFHDDFFDPDCGWTRYAQAVKFDWVVGNPPWRSIPSKNVPENYRHAWAWIRAHAKPPPNSDQVAEVSGAETVDHARGDDNGAVEEYAPVGGNQVAEAFAWKALSHLAANGTVGLLVPAMTLFKDESTSFRKEFLKRAHLWCVANFANLAYVLFSGRSEVPAAALFYDPRLGQTNGQRESLLGSEGDPRAGGIVTYSPFVVNQEANRPPNPKEQRDTWSITVNASEVRQVRNSVAATGSMLPWKVAMWGSYIDERLLDHMAGRFEKLRDVAGRLQWRIHEGFQLRLGETPSVGDKLPSQWARRSSTRRSGVASSRREALEAVEEIVGKRYVDFGQLRNCGRISSFPQDALVKIPRCLAYARKGRAKLPLSVSQPPHVVVDAARRFAVYSDEFLIVPARQIGIAGQDDQAPLLRALAAYLNSNFATYHQFFTSPEWGVHSNRATKDALEALPIPPLDINGREVQRLVDLHSLLVGATAPEGPSGELLSAPRQHVTGDISAIMAELNVLVYGMLGIAPRERAIVEDFVSTRMQMAKGKTSFEAVAPPEPELMLAYLAALRDELDAFLDDEARSRHEVAAVYGGGAAMVSVDLVGRADGPLQPSLWQAGTAEAHELDSVKCNLLRQRSQWVYFERSLRIFENTRTYLFKPLQRVLWTTSQALVDAGEIIADVLAGGDA